MFWKNCFVLFHLLVCTSESTYKMPSKESVDHITAANVDFAAKLYNEISVEHINDNILFSPLSLSLALSMTSGGARGNTEKEIMQGLGISDAFKEQLHTSYHTLIPSLVLTETIKIANNIFLQNNYDIVSSFHELLRSMYNTDCTSVNFGDASALDIVNNWVKKETSEKIMKIVDSLSSDTVMIITNAIYFKSLWEKQFNSDNTHVAQFYVNKGTSVSVNMMYQSGKFRLSVHEPTNTEVLELCHNNDQTSMLVFLPREVSGIQKLESQFGKTLLDQVLEGMTVRKTDVWFPAFKLEESYTLKNALTKLGIKDLFSADNADLTGMSTRGELYAGNVFHKSFIEVNEEGTEAAAASGVVIMKRSLEFSAPFKADHPFVFCILHRATKNILFLGKLAKPQAVAPQREEL